MRIILKNLIRKYTWLTVQILSGRHRLSWMWGSIPHPAQPLPFQPGTQTVIQLYFLITTHQKLDFNHRNLEG